MDLTRMQARPWSSALLFVALMSVSPRLGAQRADWSVEHFEPAPDQGNNVLSTVSSRLLPHLMPSFGLFIHFAKDPLVMRKSNAPDVAGETIIEDQLFGEFWASIGLFDYVNLSLVMPVALISDGAGLSARGGAGIAPGDLRIVPKVKLVDWQESGGFGLALATEILVPTGDSTAYRGDATARFQPRLILDGHAGYFQISANIAYQVRPRRVSAGVVYDDVLRWSLGIAIPTVDEMQILLNIFGNFQLENDVNPFSGNSMDTALASPIETLLGLQFRLPFELVLNAGGGIGLNRAVGAPAFRAFFSLGFTPTRMDRDADGIRDALDACPTRAEDFDDYQDDDGCPEADNDNDGIDDAKDQCPSVPEDEDDFEDGDGCPEDDNDKDGIVDTRDTCPLIAEDIDGFEDADGCPEADNDKDGLEDAKDSCPNRPEDKDGFEDEDGCPDPDNDKDGIVDAQDACPERPETRNGFKDDDGCPDTKPAPPKVEPPRRVKVTASKIEIAERVYFQTGKAKIKRQSFDLLREVAAVMVANKQLTRVRVEGHTDSRGRAGYNRRLSQKRAEAVRQFLADAGVGSQRLDAVGYGEDRPRDTNRTRKGRSNNRRVEFTILSIHGKPVESVR